MSRFIIVSLLIISILSIVGCAALFSKQEWSDNYALMEGVRATSPQMIDGNLRTIGETTFPEGSQAMFGSSPASEAIITLPEKKMIRRIVIHSDNLKTFDIFADKGGTGMQETDWQLVKEVKASKKNPVALSLPIAFPTDKIRVRVLNTSDDAALQRRESARGGFGRLSRGRQRAPAKIYEIELYGYKSTQESTTEDAVDKREQELDDLLN
jgi:hypothetical protein